MNSSKSDNTTDPKGRKVRPSLVYKLNTQLLFRLLGIFLALDIFICVSAGVSLVIYAEKTISEAVGHIREYGIPDKNDSEWLQMTGYEISRVEREPKGFKLPGIYKEIYPDNTESGSRRLLLPEAAAGDKSFLNRLDEMKYSYEFIFDENTYSVVTDFSPAILMFRRIFTVLLILQAVILFRSIFSGSRIIRRTLQPISDLAETARKLDFGDRSFAPDKMQMLAGKLDTINAARLDTRISVDETQDELKNLAAAINGMLDRINESYRSQVRFVSDASHELRTPISVIQGYANLLDRWGKNDEKTLQESINAIKEEAANMKSLVEQLLFLARGDNNTMTLNLELIELSELASEVFRETQMIDSGHDYESNFNEVFIVADKALIKQAIRILVDNSIKYTNAGGNIKIAVTQNEESAIITVQDNGIGIPPDAVPQIFDRFYRADQSRARATGGTGLGLSIAKWITERHGGHMEVLSREDIGTRISIYIPAANRELYNDMINPKDHEESADKENNQKEPADKDHIAINS